MYYDKIIKQTVLQLTRKQSYKGFSFVTYGLYLTLNDKSRLNHISKSLYIDIASKYNTTWQNVERNIRTLIDVIWRDKDNELLHKICHGNIIKKPNNKDFFILLSDYILNIEEIEIAATNNNILNENFKQYLNGICNNIAEITQKQIIEQQNTNKLLTNIFDKLERL